MIRLRYMKIDKYERKTNAKMKLKDIYQHCQEENVTPPEEYHKMVAIVDKKIFSAITMEEYDELRQFIAKSCGVKPCVMSLSKVSPFDSILLEWFIPITAVSHMVEISKCNVNNFISAALLYLKISSTVIFDHRSNVSYYIFILFVCVHV